MHTLDAHMHTDEWLTLNAYAQSEGINRTTALRRVQRGEVQAVQVFEGARPKWIVKPQAKAQPRVNMQALIARWEAEQNAGIGMRQNKPASPRTIDANTYGLELLWRMSQTEPTTAITPALFNQAIAAFPHDREAKVDHFSMKEKMHRGVISFVKFLIRHGYPLQGELAAILKLKPSKRYADEFHALTFEQLHALLAFNKQWVNGRTHYDVLMTQALICTMAMAGLRLAEVVALHLADVNLPEGWLVVKDGKGNKRREVPVCDELAQVLGSYLKHRPAVANPSFFVQAVPKAYGCSATTSMVYQRVSKLSRASGIKVHPHALRHTFATLGDALGLSPYELKELLGHADIKTTSRYANPSRRQLRQKMQGLTFFGGGG